MNFRCLKSDYGRHVPYELVRRLDKEGLSNLPNKEKRDKLIEALSTQPYFLPDNVLHDISPTDAWHFLLWKNQKEIESDGKWEYSLPTQLQWEKVARGPDGRNFPWGSRFEWTLINARLNPNLNDKSEVRRPQQAPKDVSPYGVYDLAGSVRELTSDQVLHRSWILVKGGEESFYHGDLFRASGRSVAYPHEHNWDFGIRLVRTRRIK